MSTQDRIPLVRAASASGLSYNQMLRLVMTRAIAGGQNADGRWWVDAADLARWTTMGAPRDTKVGE